MLSKASSIKKVVTHAGGYTVLTCIRMHDLDKKYHTQVMSIFTNDHERTESHSNYSAHLRVVQLLLKPQNESDKDGKVHSACFGKVELPRGCLREFLTADLAHGVQRRIISFFPRIFEILILWFVVAIFDLVHDVETIVHLSYVLTASGNLFTGITHISKKISSCC